MWTALAVYVNNQTHAISYSSGFGHTTRVNFAWWILGQLQPQSDCLPLLLWSEPLYPHSLIPTSQPPPALVLVRNPVRGYSLAPRCITPNSYFLNNKIGVEMASSLPNPTSGRAPALQQINVFSRHGFSASSKPQAQFLTSSKTTSLEKLSNTSTIHSLFAIQGMYNISWREPQRLFWPLKNTVSRWQGWIKRGFPLNQLDFTLFHYTQTPSLLLYETVEVFKTRQSFCTHLSFMKPSFLLCSHNIQCVSAWIEYCIYTVSMFYFQMEAI